MVLSMHLIDTVKFQHRISVPSWYYARECKRYVPEKLERKKSDFQVSNRVNSQFSQKDFQEEGGIRSPLITVIVLIRPGDKRSAVSRMVSCDFVNDACFRFHVNALWIWLFRWLHVQMHTFIYVAYKGLEKVMGPF